MIRDDATGWTEAEIWINIRRLTVPEAMTLRVAITTFQMSVNDPETQDLLGSTLARGYARHCESIWNAMTQGAKP